MNKLKKGDTIKCHNAEEIINLSTELEKNGYTTDFVYEKDGVKGLWLEIIKGVNND